MINTRQCKGCLYRTEEGWCIKSYVTGKSRTVINRETVKFPKNHICQDKVPVGGKDSLLPFGEGKRKLSRINIGGNIK